MSTSGEGSVTRWIGDLKSGGESAAQNLWDRYFDRLVGLARERLKTRVGGVAEDEEDAALSAFESFCRGAADGRFPRITDRDDFWRLLVVITARKACDQIQRQRAIKRGGGLVVGESDVGADLDRFIGHEPSPELGAMVVEEYQRLRHRLGDDSLRRVLDLSLEGYRREEIAAKIDRTVKPVSRKQDVIRRVWLEDNQS